MKINVRMSEVIFYRFELDVPDNASREKIDELAVNYVCDIAGPKSEWITVVDDRRVEDYEEVTNDQTNN